MRVIRFGLVVIVLAAAVLTGDAMWAQQVVRMVVPMPAELYTAKNVFIANAGADSGLFPEPFSGDTSRAYREFYAYVKTLGGFHLVSRPEDADLVLELRLFGPYGPSNANKQKGDSAPLPMLRLVIYDRPSHYVLWTMTQSIQSAVLQKTHDKNFDTAVEMLAQSLKTLTTPPAAPAAP